ncbi:unnamed protein product [Cochlearia groenlandica]
MIHYIVLRRYLREQGFENRIQIRVYLTPEEEIAWLSNDGAASLIADDCSLLYHSEFLFCVVLIILVVLLKHFDGELLLFLLRLHSKQEMLLSLGDALFSSPRVSILISDFLLFVSRSLPQVVNNKSTGLMQIEKGGEELEKLTMDESYAQGMLVLEQCLGNQQNDDQASHDSKATILLAMSGLLHESGNSSEAIERLKQLMTLSLSSLLMFR